jgi:hypothetical protein
MKALQNNCRVEDILIAITSTKTIVFQMIRGLALTNESEEGFFTIKSLLRKTSL